MRLLAGALGLAVLAAGWLYLWPAQAGGSTSYAVIVGSSMEPTLERGDLAVIRAAGSYRVGDAVLYESEQLGAKVLHRIVRVEAGRFVLKGDNNDFLDLERPTEEQIAGKLWLTAPNVGLVTDWVRRPLHAALLVGLATLLALGGGALGARGRRRGRGAETEVKRPLPPGRSDLSDPLPLLGALALAAALFAALAAISFTRPVTATETEPEAYAQQGRFSYGARVDANEVYEDGRLETGEPIFLRLVPRLRLAFAYAFESERPVSATGRIGLRARLSDGRGWERTLTLAPGRAFSGSKASLAATLDLREIQETVERMRELTGSAQTVYTVAVLPDVRLSGRAGRDPLDVAFAPALVFELGDLRLQPKLDGAGTGLGPFAPREPVPGTAVVPGRLEAGALSVSVQAARRLSLIGLVASLLLGGLALAALLQRHRGPEDGRIAARHSHLLVPVASPPPSWSTATDVADFESLVRLAERHDRLILVVEDAGGRGYLVEDGSSAYRYRSAAVPAAEPVVPDYPPADLRAEPVVPVPAEPRRPRRRLGRRRDHADW